MVQLQTKQRVLLCYYLIKFSGDDSTGTSFTVKQFFSLKVVFLLKIFNIENINCNLQDEISRSSLQDQIFSIKPSTNFSLSIPKTVLGICIAAK